MRKTMHTHDALTRAEYERELDITLAGSFPASDPPPWTLGVAAADDFFGTGAQAPLPARWHRKPVAASPTTASI